MSFNEFEEYKRQGEPNQKQKAENWAIAIGLQKVDNLTPSKYLIKTAKENIEGKIDVAEVKSRIYSYYKTDDGKAQKYETEQADKVSMHIAEILSETTFTFSPAMLFSIHKRIFSDVFPKFAGKIRDYNITKNEEVLLGKTVYYSSFQDIKDTLNYDFDREKNFSYNELNLKEKVEHIAEFISGIWQIHPFVEGNTRTIAVFTIKYLKTMGFDNVNNEFFEQNSKYFRDSLVRANYQDLKQGILYTKEFLNKFFENMLFKGKNELDSKYLVIASKTNDKNAGVNDKNVGVNDKNVGVNDKNAGVNDKNAGVNDKNVGVNDKNAGVNDKNVGVNDKNVGVNDKNVGVNDKNAGEKTPEKVLTLIYENNGITVNEIAKILKKNPRSIERAIQKLKQNNKIIRIGSDKTGSWQIL